MARSLVVIYFYESFVIPSQKIASFLHSLISYVSHFLRSTINMAICEKQAIGKKKFYT